MRWKFCRTRISSGWLGSNCLSICISTRSRPVSRRLLLKKRWRAFVPARGAIFLLTKQISRGSENLGDSRTAWLWLREPHPGLSGATTSVVSFSTACALLHPIANVSAIASGLPCRSCIQTRRKFAGPRSPAVGGHTASPTMPACWSTFAT